MNETKRLTNADLAEIKKRAEASTPGPWYTGEGYEQSNRGNYIASKSNGSIIVAEQDGTDCVLETNDATFISHARQDVPALLAEVERLRLSLESIVNIDGRYIDTEFDVEDAYKIIDEIAREALVNGEEI